MREIILVAATPPLLNKRSGLRDRNAKEELIYDRCLT